MQLYGHARSTFTCLSSCSKRINLDHSSGKEPRPGGCRIDDGEWQLGDGTFLRQSVPVLVATSDVSELEPDPEAVINLAIVEIQTLLESGSLNLGQTSSLVSILSNAIKRLNEGEAVPAANQLNAFIHQVNAQVSAGRMTEDEGQALIDLAQLANDSLG